MKTPHDPFAVGFYDPMKLPAPRPGTGAPLWSDLMLVNPLLDEGGAFDQPIGPYDFLGTNVLEAYEPGQWGILDPGRLFANGETEVSGGWAELSRATVPVTVTDGEKLERRVRLSAVIRIKAQMGEWPRVDARRGLVHALELETKLRKRAEATKIAATDGRHLATGASLEAALKATAAEIGCSLGKVRALRSSPEYLARRDAQRGIANRAERLSAIVSYHAADSWFVGGSAEEQVASADRVAAHILALMRDATQGKSRRGKRPLLPPLDLRWDAYVLVEGYAKRHFPLTPTACLMLDVAMGLIDGEGNPVAAMFSGIRKLKEFCTAAETEGSEELDPAKLAGISGLLAAIAERNEGRIGAKQLREWRKRESYQTIASNSRTAAMRRLAE